MAKKEAVIDTFEDVKIDFSNLASSYSQGEDITVFINPIPRHGIAETDRVRVERDLDGGTKVVCSARPHYDEQSKRWKVRISASTISEVPGAFRLSYAKEGRPGLVLATSRSFSIVQSVPSLDVPMEDEANSQESLVSSFVTVSDQEDESFTAISKSPGDATENSRLINEWEVLEPQLVASTEGLSSNHRSPSPSHPTSSHSSLTPSCSTNTVSVTEVNSLTNVIPFQPSNNVLNEKSSDFMYMPTAGGEECRIGSVCDSDEEKSEERGLEETSGSHEFQPSPSHVSDIHRTPSSDDPVAMTTSGGPCPDVPSLSQSVVLVDYISQAEAKAALRNNKEMVLKIAKLKEKVTSERQLHQSLKDELESREKENSRLSERLGCIQKEADEVRAQLRSRDHKIIDMDDCIKELEKDKQRYQQLIRDLQAKAESYRVEVQRLNQATKTYQTQMKLLHTENTVLRQRSTTGSNVSGVSSPPPRVRSPPKQHMVTGITSSPGLRKAVNFPHSHRHRHQAEPSLSKVQPSGHGTQPVYQPNFPFKSSGDRVFSQHEHEKESEFRRTLMGEKDRVIQCPICDLTMLADGNQQILALHVEACLKKKGYE